VTTSTYTSLKLSLAKILIPPGRIVRAIPPAGKLAAALSRTWPSRCRFLRSPGRNQYDIKNIYVHNKVIIVSEMHAACCWMLHNANHHDAGRL